MNNLRLANGRMPQIEGGLVLNNPNIYLEGTEMIDRLAKFSSVMLLSVLLLPIFVALLIIYLVSAIILSLLRLGALLSPLNCLVLWLPAFIMPGRGPAKQISVRLFRVRDNGGEYEVRMKGELIQGDIRQGDTVTISGRWSGGTLIFQNGFNHRINSAIKVKRSPWPKILVAILAIYILAGILHCIGVR